MSTSEQGVIGKSYLANNDSILILYIPLSGGYSQTLPLNITKLFPKRSSKIPSFGKKTASSGRKTAFHFFLCFETFSFDFRSTTFNNNMLNFDETPRSSRRGQMSTILAHIHDDGRPHVTLLVVSSLSTPGSLSAAFITDTAVWSHEAMFLSWCMKRTPIWWVQVALLFPDRTTLSTSTQSAVKCDCKCWLLRIRPMLHCSFMISFLQIFLREWAATIYMQKWEEKTGIGLRGLAPADRCGITQSFISCM